MSRYTIAGYRGGEKITTSAGIVELHPNDGAAVLTAAQVKYFTDNGFGVMKAADTPPATIAVAQGPEDAEIKAAMQRAQDQVDEASRNAKAAVTAATSTPTATTAKK